MRSLIQEHATIRPYCIALKDVEKGVTWKQLDNQIKLISNQLHLAKEKSFRIILFLEQDVDTVVFLLAALCAGYQVTILDPKMSLDEWKRIKKLLQADMVIGTKAKKVLLKENERMITVQQILELSGSERVLPFTETVPIVQEGSLVFLTSGSTGTPKFVQRSIESLRAEGTSYVMSLGLTEYDVFLAAIPLFHSFCCGAALWTAMECGGMLVLAKLFYPPLILNWINKYQISVLPLIPALVKFMVNSTNEPVFCNSIRYAIVGAGHISPGLVQKFKDLFNINLVGNYGSTETGGIVIRLDPIQKDQLLGKVMDNTAIIIADECGNPVEVGEYGQILVSTKALFTQYVGVATPRLENGEWWRMGDIGYFDQQNNLFLVGRVGNQLRRNGKNINPEVLEIALIKRTDIDDVVVVGVPFGQTGNDLIIAVVVPTETANLNDVLIRAHVMEFVNQYSAPDKVLFVSSIPKTSTGKVQRDKLLEIVMQLMEEI